MQYTVQRCSLMTAIFESIGESEQLIKWIRLERHYSVYIDIYKLWEYYHRNPSKKDNWLGIEREDPLTTTNTTRTKYITQHGTGKCISSDGGCLILYDQHHGFSLLYCSWWCWSYHILIQSAWLPASSAQNPPALDSGGTISISPIDELPWQGRTSAPRTFLKDIARWITTRDEALPALTDPKFKPWRTAYIQAALATLAAQAPMLMKRRSSPSLCWEAREAQQKQLIWEDWWLNKSDQISRSDIQLQQSQLFRWNSESFASFPGLSRDPWRWRPEVVFPDFSDRKNGGALYAYRISGQAQGWYFKLHGYVKVMLEQRVYGHVVIEISNPPTQWQPQCQ